MSSHGGEVFLLVWDSAEDVAEVQTASTAALLEGDRYEAAFVFDEESEAREYADSYNAAGG